MKVPKNPIRSQFLSRSRFRQAAVWICASLVALLPGTTVQAAFHLWNIREIYTDASGTYQFIELFTSDSSQTLIGGQQITVTPTGGGASHTFTIPSNLGSDTLNHALLLATSSLQGVGAPAPDYTLPNSFLFSGGGTISFFGANSGAYSALPTDGSLSRTWGDGNAVNSPQNFAGQIGVVTVPEPSVVALLALAGIGFGLWRQRFSN